VSKSPSRRRDHIRVFAPMLGVSLLACLVLRTGFANILQHAKEVGWGLVLVFALGGVAHLVKTWAWRLTLQCDLSRVSLARSFALRLISEASAMFGLPGQVLGEATRVSLLGPTVPVANRISAATLDRGLYTATAAMVSVAGMLVAIVILPLSHSWRLYALLFAGIVTLLLMVVAVAVLKRWPFMSATTRALGRFPGLKTWLDREQSVVDSAEKNLLAFYHEAPKAFWAALTLNLVSQGLAMIEVYLLLQFMGVRISFLGAFVLEAFTKFINVIGAINPGNVGTYEGGNVIVTKLFGVTSAAGLTLGLCRRARTLFWAGIGALCLIGMSKSSKQARIETKDTTTMPDDSPASPELKSLREQTDAPTVIVLVENSSANGRFVPSLAPVGTLPVLLRNILTVQSFRAKRILVCVNSGDADDIRGELDRTGRLPLSIEWCKTKEVTNFPALLHDVAARSNHIVLLLGHRSYQPALLQKAIDWKGTSGALAFTTGPEFVGISALSQPAALVFASQCDTSMDTLEQIDSWMTSNLSVLQQPVSWDSWQDITSPEDQPAAERKLDNWLVKPTDGVYARMNRRVSIPISRQLIKFPITPNMVTMFTLLVSFASGVFFARGGYWSMLFGAVLSVWASILDGCDGEVARLKLQSSDFGCWLETICDYLYYLFVFGGMSLGLARSRGTNAYLAWGALLAFGAITSFLTVSFMRQRFAGSQPEKFLAVWQKKAETRQSNPLLYLGRHTEFIIRRCFFPYALLGFAVLNITQIAFVATAIGSNLVWMIALYSCITLSGKQRQCTSSPTLVTASRHVSA
jgi:phosphatidylglycerophosphate synthase